MIASCSACNKLISITTIPGGNPVDDLIPGMWAKEYGSCARCDVMFCGDCIKGAGGKCPRCGARTEVQGPPPGKRPEMPENFKKLLDELREFRPIQAPPKPEPSPEVRQRAAELAQAKKMPAWVAEKYPEALVMGVEAENDFIKASILLLQVLGASPRAGGPPASGTEPPAALAKAAADMVAADQPGWARPLVETVANSALKPPVVRSALEAIGVGLAGPTPRPALEETRHALIGAAAALQVAVFSLLGGKSFDPDGAAELCRERTEQLRQAVQALTTVQATPAGPVRPAAGPAPSPDASRPAPAPAAAEMTLKVRCPKCLAEYTVPESKLGKRARCGKAGCGNTFRLGITGGAG